MEKSLYLVRSTYLQMEWIVEAWTSLEAKRMICVIALAKEDDLTALPLKKVCESVHRLRMM